LTSPLSSSIGFSSGAYPGIRCISILAPFSASQSPAPRRTPAWSPPARPPAPSPARRFPEARLAGTRGKIHHFAGPSWQSERDGSLVTAAKIASSARTGTISELLLQVATHTGKGILDKADYISRLATSGGVAPTTSCTAGQTAAVPYKAVYVFWDAPAA